mmetsp:Transcript_29587/g.49738  ORF Transcript_29587/g.49738 Transcript_29587/m.49738 type:complete len:338 (+) Transcript_29587:639-1652(+)
MGTASKPDEGEGGGFVLRPGGHVAEGIILVRILEHMLQPMCLTRARGYDLTLRDVVLLAVTGRDGERLLAHPHQHDQWRVDAQGFLHTAVEMVHLVDDVEVQFVAMSFDDLALLLLSLRPDHLLVREHVQARPRGGDGAGVLAGEQHRDQHAGDLIIRQSRAVLVPRVNERLQHVGLGLSAVTAVVDDLREDLRELRARPVAFAMRRDGQVREHHGDGEHAHIQMVEQLAYFLKQLLAHLFTHQTAASREDDEIRELLQKIHFAFIAPLVEESLRLHDHHAHVRAHAVLLERLRKEAELLDAYFVVDVEHDALAKGRHVEFVHLLLAHFQIVRLKEM